MELVVPTIANDISYTCAFFPWCLKISAISLWTIIQRLLSKKDKHTTDRKSCTISVIFGWYKTKALINVFICRYKLYLAFLKGPNIYLVDVKLNVRHTQYYVFVLSC